MDQHILASAPPMGWNSWNTFFKHPNAELVCQIADAFVQEGLLDAGYRYIIIDDGWAMRERDGKGLLVPDPEAFPDGIQPVIDYVHSKGLKFGLYACCGALTCARYPGSLEHEFSDAAQFAAWGVDYLKYDNCLRPASIPSSILYRRMGAALRNCGRDIVFAACQWGTEDVYQWIRSSGAHTFRSTIDIQDCWSSVEAIALSQMDKQPFGGMGCFNDMDMLVVGMYGKGTNPEACMGGCTDTEYQTHFALWAMMNSPLIIGCDVRSMNSQTKEILTNQDLIAINQDAECRAPYRVDCVGNPDAFVLVRPLCGGDYAIGFFNFSDTASDVSLTLWDIGLSAAAGNGVDVYDCITHQRLGIFQEILLPTLPSHGCAVYRCKMAGGAL
ncbi:MAG: glycoside hydrolase family 27 protein [Eubacterium sp.]|nr:glycoside hydrolase family 27 protein [Eubacterium sp.]